ncbi:MAG TPA: hypothetical protein PKK06_11985 [Phycisphaerae bacterium]|nr:hypothetical protein [Phycisphaerae bacterium]HNU45987.1 hypothetical protein [Phycisphaerae bacterium]
MRLYPFIGGTVCDLRWTLLAINGMRDSVHLPKKHHRRQDFRTEFLELLRRHGIEFDESQVLV